MFSIIKNFSSRDYSCINAKWNVKFRAQSILIFFWQEVVSCCYLVWVWQCKVIGWVTVEFTNVPRKRSVVEWIFCEFLCVKSWFEFSKALSRHWTDFEKQYGKMIPRYHTFTYLKGRFEHKLLKYQLYDLMRIIST